MPRTYVQYRHDDGRWFEARVVQQIRSGPGRRWRVLVSYATAPGFTFGRSEWADSHRLAPLGTHETYRATGADIPREIEAAQLQ